jgi:hypothetical protein
MSRIENSTQKKEGSNKAENIIAGAVLLYFALIAAKVEIVDKMSNKGAEENIPTPTFQLTPAAGFEEQKIKSLD